MVVVNQPSAPQVVETVVVDDPPNDCLVPTLCMLVLCCVCGNWLSLVCLIPALILAICVSYDNTFSIIAECCPDSPSYRDTKNDVSFVLSHFSTCVSVSVGVSVTVCECECECEYDCMW